MDNNELNEIKNLILEKQSIFILSPDNAGEENIILGLALQKVLEKKGKKVSFYCASPFVESVNKYENARSVKNLIAPSSLIISLDYDKEQIDKVSYDTKKDQFNLVVTPKKGTIDPGKITIGTTEIDADLIITLGAKRLEEMKASYETHAEEILSRGIVNIDNHFENGLFGTLNLTDQNSKNMTELIYPLIKTLEPNFKENDVADTLLKALYLATKSFQDFSKIGKETFTLVSELINEGASLEKVVGNLYQGIKPNFKDLMAEETTKQGANSYMGNSSPTPFVKGQDEKIEIEEANIFNKDANF